MNKDDQYFVLDNKFSEWFEDPGRGYIPTPEAEEGRFIHRRHRKGRGHNFTNFMVEAFLISIFGVGILAIFGFFIIEFFK